MIPSDREQAYAMAMAATGDEGQAHLLALAAEHKVAELIDRPAIRAAIRRLALALEDARELDGVAVNELIDMEVPYGPQVP